MPTEIQVQTSDKIIDLNGFFLKIQNNGVDWLKIDPVNGIVRLMAIQQEADNEAALQLQAEALNVGAKISASFNGGVKNANINLQSDETSSSVEYESERHKTNAVQEFADNDAAIAAGLPIGTTYRTGDFQKIVH